jgi:hypothetical protein
MPKGARAAGCTSLDAKIASNAWASMLTALVRKRNDDLLRVQEAAARFSKSLMQAL